MSKVPRILSDRVSQALLSLQEVPNQASDGAAHKSTNLARIIANKVKPESPTKPLQERHKPIEATHEVTPHHRESSKPEFEEGIFSNSAHKHDPFDPAKKAKPYKYESFDTAETKPSGFTDAVINGRKVKAEILL